MASPLELDQAARRIQGLFRTRAARSYLLSLVSAVITKVYDESSGQTYYYNTVTGEASWEKPKLLGSKDLEDIPPAPSGASAGVAAPAPAVARSLPVGWTTVTDPSSGATYYFNTLTRQSSWEFPTASESEFDEDASLLAVPASDELQDVEVKIDRTVTVDTRINRRIRRAGELGTLVVQATSIKAELVSLQAALDSKLGEFEAVQKHYDTLTATAEATKLAVIDGKRTKQPPHKLYKATQAAQTAVNVLRQYQTTYDTAKQWVQHCQAQVDAKTHEYNTAAEAAGETVELNLRHFLLTEIPEHACQVPYLVAFNAAHNRILSIPSAILGLTCLHTLDISYNSLTHVASSLFQLVTLTSLDLSSNHIEVIEDPPAPDIPCLGWLTNLQELWLQDNHLQMLPDSVGGCTALHVLCIQENHLHDLPSTISNLTNLVCLDFSHNNIPALPDGLAACTSLQELRGASNGLRDLISLSELASLQEIDLCCNRLAALPDMFHQTALTTLNVAMNQLLYLPTSLGQLSLLAEFDASNNRLQWLDDEIQHLSALEDLDLSHNSLKALPTAVLGLRALWCLDLSHNQLTAIPWQFTALVALTDLDLSHNDLEALDSDIPAPDTLLYDPNRPPSSWACFGCLKQLNILDLSYNKLTALPDGISAFRRLILLNVSHNHLARLPQDLGALSRLEDLQLHHNQLSTLPPSWSGMMALETLNLSFNGLQDMPSLSQLTSLRTLDVRSNRLTTLPKIAATVAQVLHAGNVPLQPWAAATTSTSSSKPEKRSREPTADLLCRGDHSFAFQMRMAHNALHSQDWKEAIRILTNALELAPKAAGPTLLAGHGIDLSEPLALRAQAYVEQTKLSLAIADATSSILYKPSPIAYAIRARALALSERLSEAAMDMEHACAKLAHAQPLWHAQRYDLVLLTAPQLTKPALPDSAAICSRLGQYDTCFHACRLALIGLLHLDDADPADHGACDRAIEGAVRDFVRLVARESSRLVADSVAARDAEIARRAKVLADIEATRRRRIEAREAREAAIAAAAAATAAAAEAEANGDAPPPIPLVPPELEEEPPIEDVNFDSIPLPAVLTGPEAARKACLRLGVPGLLMPTLIERALAKLRTGQAVGADADLTLVTQLQPGSPYCHYARAQAKMAMGLTGAAISDWTQVIKSLEALLVSPAISSLSTAQKRDIGTMLREAYANRSQLLFDTGMDERGRADWINATAAVSNHAARVLAAGRASFEPLDLTSDGCDPIWGELLWWAPPPSAVPARASQVA